MGRLIRRLAVTLAMAVLAGGLTVTAAEAAPPTCSGYGCDYLDPVVTHCADSVQGSPVASANIVIGGVSYGRIELRWSTACQTNWGRLVLNNPNNPGGYWRGVDVARQSPAATATFDYFGSGSPIYGNMLYAPGCAKAIGFISTPAGIGSATALQPGCPAF